MIILTFAIHSLGHALGLMLDMVALLIVIRAICRWRTVAILTVFDQAGRPLMDQTLRCVDRIWQRIVANRPLSPIRLLIVAWLVVSMLRMAAALFLEAPDIRRSSLRHLTNWVTTPVATEIGDTDT